MLCAIIVRRKVDRFFVQICEQIMGNLLHADFCVTHCCCGITVYRSEVALPIYQGIAQREILRHAHDSVVDSGIAVRVILTNNIAHNTS